MPAVKTHFQDLPVTLDPAQRLEIAHQHFDVSALPVQQQLLRFMAPWDAHRILREIVLLIADAFGEQAGLRGSKPALARAMAFDLARRYVHANLRDDDLSPDRVVESLGISRPTLYRLFQHDRGLAAYISGTRGCAPLPTNSSLSPAFRCRTSATLTVSKARRISRGLFGVLTASHRKTSANLTPACTHTTIGYDRFERLPHQPFSP